MDLKTENLCKIYKKPLSKQKFEAVQNVSFEIKGGEIFALLGPNGAGKSSIIKMIAGLVTPTSGRVLFDNNVQKNYEILSAVLEGNRNVYWRLTPLENLYYFANLRGVSSQAVKEKAMPLLEELEIEAKKKNQSRHLSRGMLQKLAIATALITNPKILLLDEPTLGVDVASARKIKEKIRWLAKKEGMTILLTTHQLELVDQLADRVGIIQKGKLIRQGSLNELKENTRAFVYHIGIRGKFKVPEAWNKKFKISRLKSQDGVFEFEVNCSNKAGLGLILEHFSGIKADIIFIQKKRDNLEEVFLKAIQRDDVGE